MCLIYICYYMEVFLRPIKEADTDNIVKWRNNPAVRSNLYGQEEITAEMHLNYFHKVVETGLCHQFVITVVDDGQTKDVGTTFIKNIDKENRKGEFGIFIGDNSCRGKGIGKIATEKTVEYAFTTLDMNKVYLTVFANNEKAITCYESAGFKKCAYYREEIIRNNDALDVVGMELVKREWSSI